MTRSAHRHRGGDRLYRAVLRNARRGTEFAVLFRAACDDCAHDRSEREREQVTAHLGGAWRAQTERLAAPSAEGGVWVRVASAQASGNPSPRPDRALANEIARVVRPTDRAYVGASLQERCIARVRTISNLVPEVADTVYPLGWLISTGRVSGTFVRTLAKMKAASLGSVTARIHGELSGHGVRSIADAWIAAIAAEAP